MSYDLGYELGYESDWESVPAKDSISLSSTVADTTYRMNGGPGGTGGAGPSDFVRRYMEMYGIPMPGGDPAAPPGAGGVEGATPPPPGSPGADAHDDLTGMGAVPRSPGDAPTAAPEGTPSMTTAELSAARTGAEWDSVRSELTDYYGFTPDEANAIANQYRNPTDLRTGEPPLLPAHPDSTTPMSELTTDATRRPRIEGANAIRRRVADDMVHREGGRIHGMFAEGEISRDTADAMAAQMYRRAGTDPDAIPPNIVAMQNASTRSGTSPSPIDREMTALRGTSRQPPNPSDPATGLHITDPQVRPLMSITSAHYRTRATETIAPLLGNSPGTGNYYANTGTGRGHRSADASLYLVHRGIDQDPGALRGIARTTAPASPPGTPAASRPPHPLQAEVNTFASSVGTTGPGRTTTDFRRGLETRLASDPTREPDTSGWSAADRSGYRRSMAEMRARAGIETERDIATDERREAADVRRTEREEGVAVRASGRQLHGDLVRAEANHELQMKQQHDQQLNQLMQSMANQGMQLMQSQIQMLNNLTTEQLRSINQTTTALLQQGAPRPFDIVAQMLSGGAPRR